MTDHPNILFVSPKQGGTLQSSGFLDLKSLMALNRTCKAHAFDELSLILFIENEITRDHRVETVADAISLLRRVYDKPLLRQWLERESNARTGSIVMSTRDMLSEATCYDVMLVKMLKIVPRSLLVMTVSMQNSNRSTVLHSAARSGNCTSLQLILNLFPESQLSEVVSWTDLSGRSVLHYAVRSGNLESIKTILALYPDESKLVRAVCNRDQSGRTALHWAVRSGNPESIRFIGSLLSDESERTRAMCMQDPSGETVLHHAVSSGNTDFMKAVLDVLPESERIHVVSVQSTIGKNALHWAAFKRKSQAVKLILSHLPESQHFEAVCTPDQQGRTVLHYAAFAGNMASIEVIMNLLPEEAQCLAVVSVQDHSNRRTALHDAARSRNPNSSSAVRSILTFLPESQHSQVLSMQDVNGNTALQLMSELQSSEMGDL